MPLTTGHIGAGPLCWDRETLEFPAPDAQQLVIWLPADEATAAAADRLRQRPQRGSLRAV
jgi:hypothetical protein